MSTKRASWIAVGVGLCAGAIAGLFVTVGGETEASHAHHDHAPSATPDESLPTFTLTDELRYLNGQIPARLQHAERTRDWAHYEIASALLRRRAQVTGDWTDFSRAYDALDRAFELAPAPHGGPWVSRARLDYTLHRLDGVREALAHLDHWAIIPGRDRATVRSLRGQIAFHSGDYAEARRLYEESVEATRSVESLVLLAELEWKTGHFDRAEALLSSAADLPEAVLPSNAAWLPLASALMEMDREDWSAAHAHLTRGLAIAPDDWVLEEHAAECLVELGRADEALPIYESLVERTNDPEFVDQIALIARERGETERFEQLRDRARSGHEARIALFPEAAYGHALGHYLEVERDGARAVEIAEANHRARPGGEALEGLILAYVLAGRSADARARAAELEASPYRTAGAIEAIEAARAAPR